MSPISLSELTARRQELLRLREHALDIERIGEDEIALVDPCRRQAARNLVDYLALRQHDLSDLQRALQRNGLSSLGVVQGHVVASLEAVLDTLDLVCGVTLTRERLDLSRYPTIEGAGAQLQAFADETLGPQPAEGSVRIMVTMPSDAATDPAVIDDLLGQGMSVMRVNCAHDGPAAWSAMIANLRLAEHKHERRCRVSFDLAGPKLRTGPVAPGPEVMRFKPVRDPLGRVTTPGTIRFGTDAHAGDGSGRPVVPIDPELLREVRTGDVFCLSDARGRQRRLPVGAVGRHGVSCTTERTVYLTTGTPLELIRGDTRIASGVVGPLPASDAAIPLEAGDTLVVTRAMTPGRPAVRDDDDEVVAPARTGCSLPNVFGAVRIGHRVMLDDGKFEGVVRTIEDDSFALEITRAGRGRASLKSEKGINLPDTALDVPALTDKDLEDLQFVAAHGDLVALSFVHDPSDVDRLYAEMDRLGAQDLGVILKIENRVAFERLPELLMTAAKRRHIAVMVARGDLGVEIGFERLAEVQEEILWLAEAAQTPVIWATQVLESLARDGLPSRAEVTDAAMSTRAECVMLNKGPHIGQAIGFLTDVSQRMGRHTTKTFAMYGRLNVAASEWLLVDRSAPPLPV